MNARHLRIEGRVHGVGYRDWLVREASRLGLYGWVRNRRDGSVEALVAGDEAAVRVLLSLVPARPGPGARGPHHRKLRRTPDGARLPARAEPVGRVPKGCPARGASLKVPLLAGHGPLLRDGWPSGRRRAPGKCVYVKSVSWVRIPPHPPAYRLPPCPTILFPTKTAAFIGPFHLRSFPIGPHQPTWYCGAT